MTAQKQNSVIHLNERKSEKALSTEAFYQAFEGSSLTPWLITFPESGGLWVRHYNAQDTAETVCPYEFFMALRYGDKSIVLHQMLGSNVSVYGNLQDDELKRLKILACAGSKRGACMMGIEDGFQVVEGSQIKAEINSLQIYIDSDAGDFFFSYVPPVKDYARTVVALESKKKSVKSLIRHFVWSFIIPSCE